ncbi:MAG: hypothetical protein AAGB31_05740 [Bdellovibrio sp.]
MKKSLCLFLPLILGMTGFAAFAQSPRASGRLRPLSFQADKNGLQVLPQRFEYSLMDEDRLKVGDILIDTTQVIFQVEPSQKKGLYKLSFSWPAGLLKEGQLAIKNNSGKAVFNALLNQKNVQITASTAAGNSDDESPLRSEIATYTVENVEAGLIEDMKYFPFMVFCINRESDNTRLYLCSKELYLGSQQGQMSVKSRASSKKTAQVEINGKVVGNQGLIYLNDRTENVAFKAQMQTGAFLEIETRKKDVDFKDAVFSADGENIILTASGAEPVDESKVQKISEEEWQISLPKSRPLIYLKGEGDIPMRQEFYIRKPLPSEKDRPFVSARSSTRTYASRLKFLGVTPEGVRVSLPEDEKEAELENSKKNQFSWTVHNIRAGQASRRYLKVQTGNGEYTAGYDLFRGRPFLLAAQAVYHSPSALAYGSLELQWWMEHFLGLNSDWTRFHWGLSVEHSQHLTEKSDITEFDTTTLQLLWRAREGFHLVDATWGLTLPVQMIRSESASAMAYGLGAFWMQKPSSWLKSMMTWYELKAQFFAGSSGDFKLASAYQAQALAYWNFTDSWALRYGLEVSDYKFDPAATKEETQVGARLGLAISF